MNRACRSAFVLLALLAIVVPAACNAPATSVSPAPKPAAVSRPPTPQPPTDEEAIRQLVLLEGQAVVKQDIAGLMDLWAPEAVIADAKHTPQNADDDARWRGWDAIRERYTVLVFPSQPTSSSPADIRITIDGDQAAATSTTRIGSEISPGGDRWIFVKRDGRWWIAGLTYNLEPN